MSLKLLFNKNWLFTKQKLNSLPYDFESDTISWEAVDLPHDWLIYEDDLYENSEGYYEKIYSYSPVDDQVVSIAFDGVYMDSTLYINNQLVGSWKYGYTSFEYDITSFLVDGDNQFRLQVKHEHPNSRWYSGAGVYRNVWLLIRPKEHIISNGIYISTKKENNDFFLIVSHEISEGSNGDVRHTLLDANNQIVLSNLSSEDSILVSNALPWTLENPYLYTLLSELIVDGEVVDSQQNRFGFRSLLFDVEKGFFLNGIHTKLNGVCQHHDLGALGSAFHPVAAKRQLVLLKEMGVNAIRFSHNMPEPQLLDFTDEMGILIVNEAFDMWERSKTTFDYARFFKSESEKDVKNWIIRDRNHPCVIMWSIGNEIYDTHADSRGEEVTRYLLEQVKRYDPRENAVVTIGSNYMTWENAQRCADILKVAGYNYTEKLYKEHHIKYPDWMIYGSETSSLVQSRGIYHFPLSEHILADDDWQCSALGNSITSWGAKSQEACVIAEKNSPFSLGQFLWTGFDYIGEPTPYHTRNSYFGQIDTSGFPKDSFYFYQSAWTHYKEKPMVHIGCYWDFNEGQLIDVRVMSNAPSIELFLNNVSLGRQQLEHNVIKDNIQNVSVFTGYKLIGDWQVPYEKGILSAVAYDENNEVIARDQVSSFGDVAKIELLPDKTVMTGDGEDLIFVEIRALDNQGISVENANNRIDLTIEGAGRLVGVDNGDSTDEDSYKGTSKRLFSGKLLAMVASTLEHGTVTLTAKSPGLPSATLTIQSIPSKKEPTTDALLHCKESIPNYEIPIRKIELVALEGQHFSKDKQTLNVKAILHPANATYNEITWQITNQAGVEIKLASLKHDKNNNREIKITAHGDGEFRLRCLCNNGSSHARIISSLELYSEGLGSLTQNPYEFIAGSLYSFCEGEASNGNERGVATARDGCTVITYENLDFGEYGSDQLTIPIFELENIPTAVNIYEGRTLTDPGTKVGSFVYHKPSIWNVYQEETIQLEKRLCNVTSLSFEVQRKIHIKGFSFLKKEKAWERLFASEANHIYGDTYRLLDECVEGIGNNVTLEFQNMDFGEEGCYGLTICGSCPIDKNTIHIRFTNETGEYKELAEFTHTLDYEEQSFSLPAITGRYNVTFVFLPGSNFNFKWLQFQRIS
ncbi:MAG: DUF4982 domain-containing protein [Candidatus Galacturonibacter soehngenii]|nr:DUF4982 domain-containing protein [Candidatus Galacturonibacter soehngenii]